MAQKIPLLGYSEIARNREDCFSMHALSIEKALLFGQAKNTTLGGQPIRTMSGIVDTIRANAPSNLVTAGSTTTFAQLDDMIDPMLDVTVEGGGTSRRAYVGSTAFKTINRACRAAGDVQIQLGQNSFGNQFMDIQLSRCQLRLYQHPLLNTEEQYRGMMIVTDPPAIRLSYLGDRKQKYATYNADGSDSLSKTSKLGGDAGTDGFGGTITTEVTFRNRNPGGQGVIFGLTQGA
jgi:hypothetical protein